MKNLVDFRAANLLANLFANLAAARRVAANLAGARRGARAILAARFAGANLVWAVILAAFLALNLAGCVNLKSELPKITHYKLDTIEVDSRGGESRNGESRGGGNLYGESGESLGVNGDCEAINQIALLGIDAPQGKIYAQSEGGISFFNHTALVTPLTQSLENMLLKTLDAHCIKLILPPFSVANLEAGLKLRVLDFYIQKNGEKSAAVVNLAYQIASKNRIVQSGIIAKRLDFAPKSGESGGENGRELARESAPESDEQAAINALSAATSKAFETLAQKIIPK